MLDLGSLVELGASTLGLCVIFQVVLDARIPHSLLF